MDRVNTKVLTEFNLWNNTFGAINAEPAWMSWGLQVGQNIQSVFTGNKDFQKALGQSVGMFEMLK
jgi:hypothetical protein